MNLLSTYIIIMQYINQLFLCMRGKPKLSTVNDYYVVKAKVQIVFKVSTDDGGNIRKANAH